MTLRAEQVKAREYLHQKGSVLRPAQIRERVAGAFAALEEFLQGVSEEEARARPWPGEWTVQEIVDHLVETHRPSIAELRELLEGRRPSGGPIPASLQSKEPTGRPWEDLLSELKGLHAETLSVLDGASDAHPLDAKAPVVLVINTTEPDGRRTALHWVEELDWKAYAIIFRLHTLDHLSQAKKTLKAARPA
ncbi:MAG TPA: DinB family protein [Methylomirabilota bacterium]|nr:DinB family protein [Methylomirabilota bacterium]